YRSGGSGGQTRRGASAVVGVPQRFVKACRLVVPQRLFFEPLPFAGLDGERGDGAAHRRVLTLRGSDLSLPVRPLRHCDPLGLLAGPPFPDRREVRRDEGSAAGTEPSSVRPQEAGGRAPRPSSPAALPRLGLRRSEVAQV